MEYVEVARAESERGEVVLRERRDPDLGEGTPTVLELRVNGVFVMDTRETSSEKGLASAALARVADPRAVMVAGLGMGFTAHEVLADPRVERLWVVEIEPALVGWMRDGTVPHGPAYLADDRLVVVEADIRVAMAEATPAAYDLILLDVDNGPGFLVYDDNAAVYEGAFLGQAQAALRPGGALVIWSAAESPTLHAELERVFGNAAAVPYDVQLQSREEQYWLYLARREAGAAPE
ncbi:MAG: spermidine synthase [Nocardioidaceae bacterium]